MLRLFRGTGPGTIISGVVLAGILWMNAFTGKYTLPVYGDKQMVLYRLLVNITGETSTISIILTFTIVLITSSVLISFNTNTFLIPERTFLPGVLYPVIVSLFPEYQALSPIVPAALMLFLAFLKIAGTYRMEGTAFSFFDAGLLVGTGSLIYFNLIWYGLLLFVAMALLRTFNPREIAVSVLGLITPWLLASGVFFVAGHDAASVVVMAADSLAVKVPDRTWLPADIVAALFVAASLLIAIYTLYSGFNKNKVKSRKHFSLLIWISVITLAVYFILPSAGEELIYIFAIPASYLLSHYFIVSKAKKKMPAIIFTGILILVILNVFL